VVVGGGVDRGGLVHIETLVVTAVMAILYLVAVRLVDFNEKEPLWAVLMLFVFGSGAAVALNLGVSSAFLELNLVPGTMAKELARFVAVGGGLGVMVAVGQSRGYSEVNGLMDGVVYGAAGGFGFATGLAFVHDVLTPASGIAGLGSSTIGGYGEVALVGLSDGVFGALIGIGFAAAIEARAQVMKAVAPIGGYAAAVGAHLAYDYIGRANAFGDGAVARKWIALLLPVLVVIAVSVVALRGEKQAINEELGAEKDTGAVNDDDLAALGSFFKREAMYMKALFTFQIGTWTALHGLHNRQVQLAMAKRKASQEKDQQRRLETAAEIAKLRSAIFELKKTLGVEVQATAATPPPADPGEGGQS
jgi:hypothetical protein